MATNHINASRSRVHFGGRMMVTPPPPPRRRLSEQHRRQGEGAGVPSAYVGVGY